jgi:5-formyltetrahydrofolate cyclo-ligase
VDDEERMLRRRAKVLMRKRFRSHRAALPSSAIAARSEALCARLLVLTAIVSAKQVALFWPITRFNEVDLRGVDEALRKRAIAVAYPAIDSISGAMSFHLVPDTEALRPCDLGFMAPPLTTPTANALDVVVVPGLAFDSLGYRIGYGGGFYDRALPLVCPPATAVGVAFEFQLAADIPRDENDVAVDVVITDKRKMLIGSA